MPAGLRRDFHSNGPFAQKVGRGTVLDYKLGGLCFSPGSDTV